MCSDSCFSASAYFADYQLSQYFWLVKLSFIILKLIFLSEHLKIFNSLSKYFVENIFRYFIYTVLLKLKAWFNFNFCIIMIKPTHNFFRWKDFLIFFYICVLLFWSHMTGIIYICRYFVTYSNIYLINVWLWNIFFIRSVQYLKYNQQYKVDLFLMLLSGLNSTQFHFLPICNH